MWSEIAVGSPRRRGLLVKQEDLSTFVFDEGKKQAIYRSVYLYDDEGLEYVKLNGTLKDYFGPRSIDKIPIDIDKGQNTDEWTLDVLRGVLFNLREEYEVSNDALQLYFSGTGYHIMLTNELFDFKKSKDLPFVVKQTMKSMFDDIDLSVYSRNSIIRLPHTLNTKENRFKIPLTVDEVQKLDAADIIKLSKERRLTFPYHILWAEKELSNYIVTEVPNIRALQNVVEPRNVVSCIQDIYKDGPKAGNRNNVILRIASHFRRNGIPSDACKAAVIHWNQGQLEENVILEKVEAVYNAGYQYGCNDPILASKCNPRCSHFRRKDYTVEVYSAQDLQNELEHRLTTDFQGRIIDLGHRFGLNSVDACVYPGELMTIFGPTGANKTTLAQNLVYGYDHANDCIRKEWQIPTLYLSLELSGWYMQRRALQIISGQSKEHVNQHYYKLWEFHKDELAHVLVQTVSPTVDQIQDKIKEINPACVVVDYIDLIEAPSSIRGEYETVRYISHKLSSIAIQMDLIIIQVSQISREYSRSQALDLYAGKGSGAIENASRKVLGITGTADSPDKRVDLLKNSDGDLFDYEMTWTPSFRLRGRHFVEYPTEFERRQYANN